MMKKGKNNDYSFKNFITYVLGLDIILIILAGYPLYSTYGLGNFLSAFLGLVITSLNVISGYYFISKYFDRSTNVFMKVIFGSMAVRLILLMLVIIAVILFIKIDQFSFIISLFISYICKSVIEIYFINKKSQKQRFRTTSD